MVSRVGVMYKIESLLSNGKRFTTSTNSADDLKRMRKSRRSGKRSCYLDGSFNAAFFPGQRWVSGTVVSYVMRGPDGEIIEMWMSGWR